MAEQKYNVSLSFRDDATGKFVKATNDMINSIKRTGVEVKKQGNSVVLDMDRMAKGMEKTGRAARYGNFEISKLIGMIGALRNTILVYMFALRPMIQFTQESVKAAIAQEDAEMKLIAAFAATGKATKDKIEALKVYAGELQKTTAYGDDQILSAQAILAQYKLNYDQIRRMTPAMIDLNAARRKGGDADADLASTAKILGRAVTESTGLLSRMGIVVDEATAKNKDFNGILRAVESSVGGMAVAMGSTFSGQIDKFKNIFGDFQEQIGAVITQSPVLISTMQLISKAFEDYALNFQSARQETDNFLARWEELAAAAVALKYVFIGVWVGIVSGLKTVIAAFVGWFAAITEGISLILRGLEKIQSFIWKDDPLAKAFDRWSKSMHNTSIASQKMVIDLVGDINELGKRLDNAAGNVAGDYKAIMLGAIKVQKQMADIAAGLPQVADDSVAQIKGSYDAITDITTKAVTGMRDMFVDGFFMVIKEGFDDLGDVVTAFGDMMLKALLQMMVQSMMIKAGLGAFLGFPGGVAAHTGGYFMGGRNSFGYGRKKFHSGGEVPATLLEGEGVVNQTGMRTLGIDNLNKLNRGERAAGGSVINNYYIQTIDERSFTDRLKQHGGIYRSSAEQGFRDNGSLRRISQRLG